MRNTKKKPRNPLTTLPNFHPLLSVLRAELGLNWGIYNEFLEEIHAAFIAGENTTTWTRQIEPLMQNEACRVAHQGVLFLLGDMHARHGGKKSGTAYESPHATNDMSLLNSGKGTEDVSVDKSGIEQENNDDPKVISTVLFFLERAG